MIVARVQATALMKKKMRNMRKSGFIAAEPPRRVRGLGSGSNADRVSPMKGGYRSVDRIVGDSRIVALI